MATKLGKVVTHNEKHSLKMSRKSLIMWFYDISLLTLDKWLLNMGSWGLSMRSFHP